MGQLTMPKGIRTRGDKFFVDVTVNGTRKTATVATYDEALARKVELVEALETGKDVRQVRANAVGWTLQQALDKTLSMPKPDGWRGISYEKQATLNAQDALTFFGPDTRLSDLTKDRIRAWFADCEARGNSDATINRKRSALSKLAKVAHEEGGLPIPLALPKQRIEAVNRIRQISKHEEELLLATLCQLGATTMADAVAVLIDTGMRCGELLNLRPVDVDLQQGVVLIYGTEGKGTKNGKVRSVFMTRRVKDILGFERMKLRTCFEDLSKTSLRHSWDRARAMMGLADDPHFVPHVCRHTCASRLVRAGVSLPVVQQWLGHSNIATTMRYAHLYPTDLKNAVKALED